MMIDTRWEAVGPFPSGMREHPITASPLAAFLPLDSDPDLDFARRRYDESETWPSELGFGGRVGWRRFETGEDGWTEVSYPEIRWDQLRSDHGWAALQFQSVLRTSLTIPSVPGKEKTPILFDVLQGTEFALIPRESEPSTPTIWYTGDVYAFAATPSGTREATGSTSNFARSLAVAPGKYTLLIRAMYEIRMFGDPGMGKPPVIRLKVQVDIDDAEEPEVVLGTAVVPDMVNGWLMGEWMSIGLRVPEGKGDLSLISVKASVLSVELSQESPKLKVLEGQLRPVALRIKQDQPLYGLTSFLISLNVSTLGKESCLEFRVSLRTREFPGSEPFKISFASPSDPSKGPPALVSYAIAVPPAQQTLKTPSKLPPVILATHGAGVDVESPFWPGAMPSRPGGWAVLPTGKTEWGEDWHGGSMADAWAARDVLPVVVKRIGVSLSEETLLIGHSNGGQGAWHLAARYPERIVGVIAASGWLKIQDYVPFQELTSHHFADPALTGLLLSSLTPYNDDLYASNLAYIPVLAVHGSDDDNVPPRHGREHVALISAWEGDHTSFKMLEIPKRNHWWDDVFREEEVVKWINELGGKRDWDAERKKGFTLTTANPMESGGRAGIRILEMGTPGRLARLDVNGRQWRRERRPEGLDLRGMNVERIEVMANGSRQIMSCLDQDWIPESSSTIPSPSRAYGPMIRLLATAAPFVIVHGPNSKQRDLAKRIACDVYLYHRIDSEILNAEEALERSTNGTIGQGSLIVLGSTEENLFTAWLMAETRIPLSFPEKGEMSIAGRLVYEKGAGIISLHPHPTSPTSLAALIAGNDDEGFELAARLFPLRTGIPVPDWTIVSSRTRWQAAGGMIGAGFWNGYWGWSEAMSWLDR